MVILYIKKGVLKIMSNDFSLAIYKHRRRDGTEVFVPLPEMDESALNGKKYELRKVFYGLSAMECSIVYNTAMILRWTMNEEGLLSRLSEILN